MSGVSAKAAQMVVITYPYDAPNRMVPAHGHDYAREVTLTTEEAADLYGQLKVALFD